MGDVVEADFELWVRVALLAVLGIWLCWCLVALVVAVFDRRLAAKIGPPLLRGLLVAGTCAATAVPAHASASRPAHPLDGLLVPDRPATTSISPVRIVPAAAPVTVAEVVTVRAGDSLWSIVRARLPDADDADIAVAVGSWYAANRDVIGDDPDLIHPGQRLTPPGAA